MIALFHNTYKLLYCISLNKKKNQNSVSRSILQTQTATLSLSPLQPPLALLRLYQVSQ